MLKNLLFKVAECKHAQYDPSKWAHVHCYRNHEKFEHSSIFVEKHLLYSGDTQYEDWYGTVSSTLLIQTENNFVYLFERVYDHARVREERSEDEESVSLLLDYENPELRRIRQSSR